MIRRPVKPKRLTDKELAVKVAKAKDKNKTLSLKVPKFGSLTDTLVKIAAFADKHGLELSELNMGYDYWGVVVKASVPETPEDKFKRIKAVDAERVRNAQWAYKRNLRDWQMEQDFEKAETLRNSPKACCPKNCCCRNK